jgi:hypothetical protein
MARKQSGISQQPYLNHDIKTQGQQARFLDSTPEQVRNLGHPSTVDRLTENPAGRVVDYTNSDVGKQIAREGQRHTQGVYGRHSPTPSGVSTAENLQAWSKYSTSNSYTGRNKAGLGKPPSMPDPRPPGVRQGAGAGSDGHLLRPEWDRYQFGADSGPGRIEKQHSRK